LLESMGMALEDEVRFARPRGLFGVWEPDAGESVGETVIFVESV